MNSKWMFLTVFLTLTSFSLNISAEPAEHSSDSVDTASKQRTEADLLLSKNAVNFISANFWMPPNVIQEKYGKKIPVAMEKALKADESEMAPIVAKLMGTLNSKQTEHLALNALQLRKVEAEKSADSGKTEDKRYLGFLDRFIWAALKAEPSLPETQDDKTKSELKEIGAKAEGKDFTAAFEGDFAKIKEQNDITLEKIKQASEGNNEAIKWVKDNLNQKSLLRWAEGQKKTGNTAGAEKLIDALSIKVGNQKVLDMWNGKEAQRLFLGTSKESLSKAIDKMFSDSASKGFGSAMVAYKPHPGNPAKQWFVDDTGAFKAGAPAGFVPLPTQDPLPVAVAKNTQSVQQKSQGSGAQQPSQPSGGGSSSQASNAGFARFMAIVGSKQCSTCHGSSAGIKGSSFSNINITKDDVSGKPLSSFIGNLDKMKAVFSADEIKELKQITGF